MTQQDQPMNFNPGPTPTSAKKNNTALIIAIVVIVILCCCCIGGTGAYWLWNHGDRLTIYPKNS